MWFDRPELRRTVGLRFWRLLGTARGQSMSLSADLDRWAMFAVWDDADALSAFTQSSAVARRLRAESTETCTVELEFLSGHGAWGGEFPFERGAPAAPLGDGEPVAVLTRATVRASRLRRFHRAVPDVDRALANQPGVLRSVGIGEWPLVRQATFSIWNDSQAMTRFAYREHGHREVVTRTRDEAWFREEMFCRFRIINAVGTWSGRSVLDPEHDSPPL